MEQRGTGRNKAKSRCGERKGSAYRMGIGVVKSTLGKKRPVKWKAWYRCTDFFARRGRVPSQGWPFETVDPPPAKKIIELVPKRGVNDDRQKRKTRTGLPRWSIITDLHYEANDLTYLRWYRKIGYVTVLKHYLLPFLYIYFSLF